MGKCPNCEKAVTRVNLSPLDAGVPFGTQYKAITYNCPMCSTVLSVAIDPVALKADIVAEVVKKLRGA